MFVGTNELNELATYFRKNGKYPYQDEYEDIFREINAGKKASAPIIYPTFDDMSYSAQEFGNYWIDRCVTGASIGGVPYVGEHIFYLNFGWIERTAASDDVHKNRKGVGHRVSDFPDFWDEDYRYYMTCHIARHGISLEKYRKLCEVAMDLELVEEEDNLEGGLHHVWAKSRGVGASWKGGNWNCYNLYLLPDTKNFIFAETKEYLGGKDGMFAKFNHLRSFVQEHVWFLRKNFVTESISSFEFATGMKVQQGNSHVVKGFNSSVAGIVIDGDTDKPRGKRGNGTFEEFGTFNDVDAAWQTFHASVNEYGITYAQARGFGTGGDKKQRYEAMEKMATDPKSYNIIRFKNLVVGGLPNCMFTPGYINVTYKDENGNSLKEEAKAEQEKERERLKQAPDPSVLTRYCAEYPFFMSEMFNASGVNILPVELAKEVLNTIKITNSDRKAVSYGKLEKTLNGKIKFTLTDDLPYEAFPTEKGHNAESCVCILTPPFKINGVVPKDLYRIAVDPYSQAETTDSASVGDIRVIENINTMTPTKGDYITAWYRGRPEGHDGTTRFAAILFLLAEYYNAKIGLENDQVGDIISYAKTHRDSKGRKLTYYLEEQFELDIETVSGFKVKTGATKRRFGMHMTEPRKLEGLKQYQQWLLRPRYTEVDLETGEEKIIRNIHTIKCRAQLQEIISYRGQNADSISSMIIGCYHEKELQSNDRRPKTQSKFATILEGLELFQ